MPIGFPGPGVTGATGPVTGCADNQLEITLVKLLENMVGEKATNKVAITIATLKAVCIILTVCTPEFGRTEAGLGWTAIIG
jgi:hypothetical protein